MKWAMKKTNLQDFGDKNEQFLKNYEYITERWSISNAYTICTYLLTVL